MSTEQVKSGKEVLDDFFANIGAIENVDKTIANSLSDLFASGKFTDKNIINEFTIAKLKNASFKIEKCIFSGETNLLKSFAENKYKKKPQIRGFFC